MRHTYVCVARAACCVYSMHSATPRRIKHCTFTAFALLEHSIYSQSIYTNLTWEWLVWFDVVALHIIPVHRAVHLQTRQPVPFMQLLRVSAVNKSRAHQNVVSSSCEFVYPDGPIHMGRLVGAFGSATHV
jgi:hypothetical protein